MAATWTNIDDTFLEPGKPVRSVDGLALRDNPVAIAEGAAGAPKVQNAALDDDVVDDRTLTGAATSVGRDWVLARTALAAVGAVGTYGLFSKVSSGTITEGQTAAGSNLRYDSAAGGSTGGAPSGTWRAMGRALGGSEGPGYTTVYLRIS